MRPLVAAPGPPVAYPAVAVVEEQRRRRAQRRRRRAFVAGWTAFAVAVAAGCFAAGLLSAPVDFASPVPPSSTVLLDASGQPFAVIPSPQARTVVPAAAIPGVMRQAIVAAEDEHFYSEGALDPLAVLRAAWRDVTGAPLQGGSTITQQYVKNVYVGAARTPLRKLREAALAYRLDHRVTKDDILTRYLNTIYFGNGAYGVEAASRFYFGVGVSDLGLDPATGARSATLALARAAVLAGLGPAPSAWNPVANPRMARQRQLYVLNRMVANRMITTAQASAAYGDALPHIVAQATPPPPTIAPEFRDLVAAALARRFGTEALNRGDLRVTTTLNALLQEAVVQAIHQVLPAASDPEAAVVAVDPRTGDIRALAEKRDGGYRPYGFDLATDAVRSSGSTIKPFTLAVALAEGHSLDEVRYGPHCITIPNPGGAPYRPCNAGAGEAGSFTLRQALAYSVNTIYAPLAQQVGLRRVLDTAQAAGMAPAASFAQLDPAKALGVDITPISEAQAYATLVDHGVRHRLRAVTAVRSTDTALHYAAPAAPAGTRVLPASIADQVVQAMGDVVSYGTGTAAAQPFPVYGKTGTTDNEDSAWFTGCTPTLCLTVWMGYDTPRPMLNVEGVPAVYGGTLPAQIFARTYADYRALRAAHPGASGPKLLASPTPAPVVTFAPAPGTPAPTAPAPPSAPVSTAPVRPTASAAPQPSRSGPSTPPPLLPLLGPSPSG